LTLGAVHKRRTQSEGLSSADKGKRFFRCGCTHFMVQNISDFFKFMVRPHGQGGEGWASADRGVNFTRLCVDVLDGRPLSP